MAPPFSTLKVCVAENIDRSVKSISFIINGEEKSLDTSLLSGLDHLSEPDIFISNSAIPRDGSVRAVSVVFEYGEGYEIKLHDVPGCKESCVDWIRNHVYFIIDDQGKISREIKQYEELELKPLLPVP